jgi:hypothetical protein
MGAREQGASICKRPMSKRRQALVIQISPSALIWVRPPHCCTRSPNLSAVERLPPKAAYTGTPLHTAIGQQQQQQQQQQQPPTYLERCATPHLIFPRVPHHSCASQTGRAARSLYHPRRTRSLSHPRHTRSLTPCAGAPTRSLCDLTGAHGQGSVARVSCSVLSPTAALRVCDAERGEQRQIGGITSFAVLKAAVGEIRPRVISAVTFLASLAMRSMAHSVAAMGRSVPGLFFDVEWNGG